jgi:hypothetical protein
MEENQGIMPTVTPGWPEFTASAAANGTYMLTANYAVSGTLSPNANITIIFAGGRFTGSGTINGNNTTFIAPPIQVFDSTINFSGTWKMEKVYAENFGDTNVSTAQVPINKALVFSNLTGCIVQLLSKTYNITDSIVIRGNTTLQGTIKSSAIIPGFDTSKAGTLINTTSSINMIKIETTGQSGSADIDCYRFAIKDLALRHSGSNDDGNSIYINATGETVSRNGVISNLIIRHMNANGYGMYISGGSYIEFHNIEINGGQGVLVTGNKLQEFLWFNKVYLGDNGTSFEITHGNNLYLTEIDTNDSNIGLYINNRTEETNQTGETYNIFVNRLNSARCGYGIYLRTFENYMTRIKISEATIFQTNNQSISPIAALYFQKNNNQYFIDDCLFENINVDSVNLDNTDFRAILDNNSSIYGSRFINIRTTAKIDLNSSSGDCQLTLLDMRQGWVYKPGESNTAFTYNLTSNSPYSGKPIVIVSTNKQVPFSVVTNNTQGGICSITVTFASSVSNDVEIYYYLTGYFYT